MGDNNPNKLSSLTSMVGNMANLPNLKFKFDVSQIKHKIDEVEHVTKKTFSAITGLPIGTSSKKKSKYYYDLKNDMAPGLTEEQFAASIPEGFFKEGFDPTRYILDSLPNTNDDKELDQYLDARVNDYSRSMDYVNSKLFSRVRKNYTEFVEGMAQIHEIGVELQSSTVMCSTGRRTLAKTKKNLTHTAFFIMSRYKKRTMYQKILTDLTHIQSIVTLERMLKQSLSDGDYPTTIKLYLECRRTIHDYGHYSCIPELDSNLHQIYQVVQERIDKDFLNSCRMFNPTTYQRVFTAYKLLGRGNSILDKLKINFVDPIEPETRNIVFSHVLLSEVNVMNPEQFKGVGYKELCKSLQDEHFVNCLLAIFEYLCDIMTSLYLMNQFHVENPIEEESKIFSDISSALTRFKKTIWDTMQKQVTHLLDRKLVAFKIDDFLLILNSVTKISEIGEEFSGSPSHHLRKSIIDQSKSFFEFLHKSKVDDIRTVLENEFWTHIPVQSDFSAKVELRLDKRLKSHNNDKHLTGDQLFHAIQDNGNPFSQLISYKNKRQTSNISISPTNLTPSSSSPSLKEKEKEINKNNKDDDSSSEEEYYEEEEEDSDDENNKKNNNKKNNNNNNNKRNGNGASGGKKTKQEEKKEETKNVLVSSATISFVRNIANLEALTTKIEKTISQEKQNEDLSFTKPALFKFINRMKERLGLPLIATASSNLSSITSGLSTIGNISGISSFANLASNQFSQIKSVIKETTATVGNKQKSPNLDAMYATPAGSGQLGGGAPASPTSVRWIAPRINYSALELGDPNLMFNLPVRIIAVESLSFIEEALRVALSVFQPLLPSNHTDKINEFYAQVISIIPDLQTHFIKTTVSAYFSHACGPLYFSNTIAEERWNNKEVRGTKMVAYAEDFLKEFNKFFKRLDDAIKQQEFITAKEKKKIVVASLEFFVQQLVDGYSRVKSCSPEGRNNMVQDLLNISAKLEKLAGVPFNVSYAQNYLRGYITFAALTEPEIIQWARDHEEYPIKHVSTLVLQSVSSKIDKNQLVQHLEEMDRKRRHLSSVSTTTTTTKSN
ncbi:hypothetical protein DFA_04362 [Cavenderia fasciculata]|uniref:Uncharacterized protein n=1 Tax=Cavenderia fasciculata TaxID=261658 RepID=F4PPD1_CACFS|nr:uncharacterized protein DFA_04362 [Cavenderia fasciculata]EGG22244.1 hypothetical protein DFA_04362 [Cavenderia fasciculata]|eukprot:XP_004360095.1 hypothetical protein DFA_04362 [Cavenderia fasciculata]